MPSTLLVDDEKSDSSRSEIVDVDVWSPFPRIIFWLLVGCIFWKSSITGRRIREKSSNMFQCFRFATNFCIDDLYLLLNICWCNVFLNIVPLDSIKNKYMTLVINSYYLKLRVNYFWYIMWFSLVYLNDLYLPYLAYFCRHLMKVQCCVFFK